MANTECCWQCSGRLDGVEPVAGGGAACPKSLATARPACGHSLRPRATNRHNLASCRRGQPRLPRLLLLPGGPRTQDQIGCHPVAHSAASHCATSRPDSGGHRRHAHQAIRSDGRRSRHSSQPHARPGRPKVSLRAYLGDALVGRAASTIRSAGPALAGHALRPPQNDGQDSDVAGLDIRHQACAGSATGRVDRSDRQTSRKNAVGRRRWRLCEGTLPETRLAPE